jgi:hypothetical protein
MKTNLQPPKTAELHNELYKTEEEQQIFLVFSNLETRTKGNKQTKQNLFGFSHSKPTIFLYLLIGDSH